MTEARTSEAAGVRAEISELIECLGLGRNSTTSLISARTRPLLLIVALCPGAPVPRGLKQVSALDASDLLNAALHEIRGTEDGERNQPVSASKEWRLPEIARRSS